MSVTTRVVSAVKSILAEDKGKWWAVPLLVAEVSTRINQANLNPIKRAISVMMDAKAVETGSGGMIGSYGRRNRNPMLRYREESASNEIPSFRPSLNDGEVSRVRAENENMRAENEGLKKSVSEAAKLLAEAKAEGGKDRIVEVRLLDGKDKVVASTTGLFHEKFGKLLKLAEARKHIFIYGPTGCGKSHICGQLAKSMKLDFAFISCSSGMSEGHITGRLLPIGESGTFEYVESEFVRCYEKGGVFLLDELDAADANVLLVINSALANGKMAINNRPEKPYAIRHKNFICVAAANTVGTGANRLYAGRNKLDAATLDRFAIGKVFMDYDPRVEEILCPDNSLRSILLRYRKAINVHGVERAMSTRFMADAYDMIKNHGWTMAEVNEAFFSGWREDEVSKVKNYVGA